MAFFFNSDSSMSATFTLVHAKIKTKVLITLARLNPFTRWLGCHVITKLIFVVFN